MQLQLSTWPEVERYLESSAGILMPIGSTEQHGPSGLIGTDAICAEVTARAAGESLGAMVGPTINGVPRPHGDDPSFRRRGRRSARCSPPTRG